MILRCWCKPHLSHTDSSGELYIRWYLRWISIITNKGLVVQRFNYEIRFMKYVYYWAQNIYGDFFLLTTSELTISYTAPDDMDTQIEKYWGNC